MAQPAQAVLGVVSAAVAALDAAPLLPAPASVGDAEPQQLADLPAVLVHLDDLRHRGAGLGQGLEVIDEGALEVQVSMDLPDATLADDPSVDLWDAGERILTLPHGLLVRADRVDGPLGAADIEFTVDGVDWPVVDAAPAAGEIQVDPLAGAALFGSDPGAVTVDARYHVGRWERDRVRLEGRLLVDVVAASAGDVAQLTEGALTALTASSLIGGDSGFLRLAIARMSTVGAVEAASGGRRRSICFDFTFEHVVDRPSSGGVLARIPLTTRMWSASIDARGRVTEQQLITEDGVGVPIPPPGE